MDGTTLQLSADRKCRKLPPWTGDSWEMPVLNPAFAARQQCEQLWGSKRPQRTLPAETARGCEAARAAVASCLAAGDAPSSIDKLAAAQMLDRLGGIHEQHGQWSEAEEAYRAALGMVLCLPSHGLPGEESFDKELVVHKLHRALGMVFKGWGKYEAAEAEYGVALDRSFDLLTARNLVQLCFDRRQHAKAYEAFFGPRRLIDHELPDSFVLQLLHSLTHCDFFFGDMEAAFRKAVSSKKKSSQRYGTIYIYERARYYWMLGLTHSSAVLLRSVVGAGSAADTVPPAVGAACTVLLAVTQSPGAAQALECLRTAPPTLLQHNAGVLLLSNIGNALRAIADDGLAARVLPECLDQAGGAPLCQARTRCLLSTWGEDAAQCWDHALAAMTLYEQHLPQTDPEYRVMAIEHCAQAFLQGARLQQDQGQWAGAQDALQRCVDLLSPLPDYLVAGTLPTVHAAMADCSLRRGRVVQAQTHVEQATASVRAGVQSNHDRVLKAPEERVKALLRPPGDGVRGVGMTKFPMAALAPRRNLWGLKGALAELVNGVVNGNAHSNFWRPPKEGNQWGAGRHGFGFPDGLHAVARVAFLWYLKGDRDTIPGDRTTLWMTNSCAAVVYYLGPTPDPDPCPGPGTPPGPDPKPASTLTVVEAITLSQGKWADEDQLLKVALHVAALQHRCSRVCLHMQGDEERPWMDTVLRGMGFVGERGHWSADPQALQSPCSDPGVSMSLHDDDEDESLWDDQTDFGFVLQVGDGMVIPYLKCRACGQPAAARCSGCKLAGLRYCSTRCQRAHWPEHKGPCKAEQKRLASMAQP